MERHQDHTHPVAVAWEGKQVTTGVEFWQLPHRLLSSIANLASFRCRDRAYVTSVNLVSSIVVCSYQRWALLFLGYGPEPR